MRSNAAAALAVVALVVAVVTSACGGASSAVPGSPSPATGAIVIDILGINGSRSFSPNPADVPAGQTVVWHNLDIETHRIVLDDGRLDTGDIAPGRYSGAMTMGAPAPYHCSIHPPMVGTIGGR